MEGLEPVGDESVEDDVFLQDDLSQTIAEHATQCQSLFHKYMAMPEIVPDPTIMDDQLARFSLWASNMDVYGPLNVSLDYRLRFSPTAADIIHQLLDIICDTLLSLKPIDDCPPQSSSRKRQRISTNGNSGVTRRATDDDVSDSESDADPAEENILKITETIGGTLTRLFRLSNAVRKSAKANRARKIERYRDDEQANKAIDELRLYTKCYIEFRFPKAPEALRSALVEANAVRLRRLCYQRSHRRRIGLSIQSPEATPVVPQLPMMKEGAPAVRFAPSGPPQLGGSDQMAAPSPAPPATNATTARQTAVAAFYAKSTTEVPRAKSILVNNKLSFPPMPPTQECPYCGVIVEFKNSGRSFLWQNHVIGDLEPFICVFSHCLEECHHGEGTAPLTFETSKAWASHMQTAHGHTWECRAPSHGPIVFEQEIQYREHAIKEHEVPEAHAGALCNAARRPVPDRVMECPFGDDFVASGKLGSSAVFSSEALQAHVAGHMKEIALLTLHKLPGDDNDDESAENVDSDRPLQDDDDGSAGAFGITRASMYSVLDDEDLDFQDNGDLPSRRNGDLFSSDDDTEGTDSGIKQPIRARRRSNRLERKDLDFRDGGAKVVDGNAAHREDEDISARVIGLGLETEDDSGVTKLHQAVQAGDLGLVNSLIQHGASLNSRDEHGQTPLYYAVESGFTEGIESLVKHGADLHIVDHSGFSPFLWAVVAGRETVSLGLLLKGADANSLSADGKSALAWAASLGYSPTANMLLHEGAGISNLQNAQQRTLPLGEAAASGDLATVRLLLQRGDDPNRRDRDGWSAIHRAAEEGHLEVVLFLLDASADPNAVSSYGTSPLHCAASGGHVSIVSLLLLRSADPLKSTCHGWTALHHAAYMGHALVVQRLLEDSRVRSAASQQDNHGWSVLHLAVQSRDLPTVFLILDIPDIQTLLDEGGLTAEEWLDFEPGSQSQQATDNLSFSKSRCCRSVTGLRQAVVVGSIPMVRLLLKSGHDINGVNSGRRTALYYAANKGMLPIVDLLLSHGADYGILPVGRKNWEDFIPPGSDVLRRLNQSGYRYRDADRGAKTWISQAFRMQTLPPAPDPPPWPGEPAALTPTSPTPDRLPSPVPASSTPPSPDHAASSEPATPPAVPAPQTNDNKRKTRSSRRDWWRRLIGRRKDGPSIPE